jgi:hypothetical protein
VSSISDAVLPSTTPSVLVEALVRGRPISVEALEVAWFGLGAVRVLERSPPLRMWWCSKVGVPGDGVALVSVSARPCHSPACAAVAGEGGGRRWRTTSAGGVGGWRGERVAGTWSAVTSRWCAPTGLPSRIRSFRRFRTCGGSCPLLRQPTWALGRGVSFM